LAIRVCENIKNQDKISGKCYLYNTFTSQLLKEKSYKQTNIIIMKRQQPHSAPQPKSNNSSSYLLLLVLGIISLFVILQTFGIFKTVDTGRTVKDIDLNSAEYQNKPMPKQKSERPRPHVEATLTEIAAEFEGKVFSDIRTANEQKGWGLSDDEAKYYDDMRKRYASTDNNWLGLVKKSYSTYRTVKEMFGGSADVSAMLQDVQSAASVYNKITQSYGIPKAELVQFAQSKQGADVSDWASFIENNKRR
jgi:hypothetical protein